MSQKKQILTVCLLLAAMTFAVFRQIRRFDFVNIDDKMYIVEYRHVLSGLTNDGVKWALTSFHASNWHLLTWLSHMLDIDLFGVNAGCMYFREALRLKPDLAVARNNLQLALSVVNKK